MSVDISLDIVKKIFDVLLVWALLYFVLKSLRKNVKMILLFKIVLIIVIIKLLAVFLNLATIGFFIDYIIEWAPLALIIIFQPEIRTALDNLGHVKLLGKHKTLSLNEREKTVMEIIDSLNNLRRQRMGALIVIERDDSLAKYINNAQRIYAEVTSPLLTAVFFLNNPLHDGGVIIQGNQLACANAIFPTSDNPSVARRLGTRHLAALGISERSDCISIILSEETNRISLAISGKLLYNLSLDELKRKLLEYYASSENNTIDDKEVIE